MKSDGSSKSRSGLVSCRGSIGNYDWAIELGFVFVLDCAVVDDVLVVVSGYLVEFFHYNRNFVDSFCSCSWFWSR